MDSIDVYHSHDNLLATCPKSNATLENGSYMDDHCYQTFAMLSHVDTIII